MATMGRDSEIRDFIESLLIQDYKDFELIIVDQNDDSRVARLYDFYKEMIPIQYFRSTVKGLSYNRNIGLKYITGNIVAFPDDDCEYDRDTLQKVAYFFDNSQNFDFYTCNTKEKHGNRAVVNSNKSDCVISLSNFLKVGISFAIFIRAEAIHNFSFDEKLGVGTEFGSGEESDMLLYLIKNNHKGYYNSKEYIFHPFKEETLERLFEYGKGYGAIHKKAIEYYGFYSIIFRCILLLITGIIRIVMHPFSKAARVKLQGRIMGFKKYKIINNKTGVSIPIN